jgi:hypothetical protein
MISSSGGDFDSGRNKEEFLIETVTLYIGNECDEFRVSVLSRERDEHRVSSSE